LHNTAARFIVGALTATSLHKLRLKRQPRMALVLLCLLACTTQSFVAQTHVHAPPVCGPATVVAADCTPDSGSAKHSRGNDAGCPLCQVVLHGATAPLAADTLSISLLAENSSAAPEQPEISSIAAVSYHWRSRGPPSS